MTELELATYQAAQRAIERAHCAVRDLDEEHPALAMLNDVADTVCLHAFPYDRTPA